MGAYLILLKAFNVTRVFDRIMIFFTFSFLCISISIMINIKKRFSCLLGNLLPQEYETIDRRFLFNKYLKKRLT